jgi:hypothetical protein
MLDIILDNGAPDHEDAPPAKRRRLADSEDIFSTTVLFTPKIKNPPIITEHISTYEFDRLVRDPESKTGGLRPIQMRHCATKWPAFSTYFSFCNHR